MRILILIAALGLITWSSPAFRAWSATLFEEKHDPHAVAAIELRCASELDSLRGNCARDLQSDFDLGLREPETIVRLHCTKFSSDWANTPRTPLSICNEIYGGWIKG
jgi:hypothetical protein